MKGQTLRKVRAQSHEPTASNTQWQSGCQVFFEFQTQKGASLLKPLFRRKF
jgi:hypothetical protein